MTDKVQKIREEVVRMHNLLPVMDGGNISVNYADRICTTLEMYIDSLQEEPVGEIILDGTNFNKSWYAHPELAFKAGAKWHQNSIWHDANKEEPKIGKAFATIDSKGVMCAEYHVFEGGLTFKQMKEMDDIVKWAYTEDLIPKD